MLDHISLAADIPGVNCWFQFRVIKSWNDNIKYHPYPKKNTGQTDFCETIKELRSLNKWPSQNLEGDQGISIYLSQMLVGKLNLNFEALLEAEAENMLLGPHTS